MQRYNTIRGKYGRAKIRIEGYFVERFINLCNINGIEIWDIININGANVEFYIDIKDFKKLKKISKITKCKIKIISKKGIYFFVHKYRKRKALLISLIISCLIAMWMTTLVFNIEIDGLQRVKEKQLLEVMKKGGISKYKSRLFIKPFETVRYVRANIPEITWLTINIRGTNVVVKVKERKETVDVEKEENYSHIVANKDGVITKIIAENGTKLLKEGDYISKGQIAICGAVQGNKTELTYLVKSRGIVRANIKYNEKFEMSNTEIKRNYDGKKYYLIGFGLNNKEVIVNYLIKCKKYDINREERCIKIFRTKNKVYTINCKYLR